MIKKYKFGENVVVLQNFKDKNARKEAIDLIVKRRPKYLQLSRSVKLWREKNLEKAHIQCKTKYLRRRGKIKMSDSCQICGSVKNLMIHHIKYTVNKKDLLTVCGKCHRLIHSR